MRALTLPAAARGPLARADLRGLRAVRSRATGARAVVAVRGFSELGQFGALWLALGTAGAAVDAVRRPRWLRATAAVVAAYALNTALKPLVRRRRPALADLPPLVKTPTQLSFPSAHAATSFAAARAFAPLAGPAGTRALYATATGLALSRVFLGVHYPSDIAAGAVLGTVVGSAGRSAGAAPSPTDGDAGR